MLAMFVMFVMFVASAAVPVQGQADEAQTIPYTTAFSGDGETGGCPNTATLGLLVNLFSPYTGYDWYNLCFGSPASSRVHVEVVDDTGLPVRASMRVRTPEGSWVGFRMCNGAGTFDLPVGAVELSVTLHATQYPYYPPECPVSVLHGTPTTGAVTVTYL